MAFCCIIVYLMSQISDAYTVAHHIHESFFAANDILTAEEIAQTGVRVDPDCGPNHTQSLYIRGELEGRGAYQTLSLGKDGKYYFSTVFTEPGGEYRLDRITQNSPLEKLETLASSLYMSALVKIANSRQD
jgi:hypothetical protein